MAEEERLRQVTVPNPTSLVSVILITKSLTLERSLDITLESSNASMQTFYNHDTQQDGHGSTESYFAAQSNNNEALESDFISNWAHDEQQSLQAMEENHSMQQWI